MSEIFEHYDVAGNPMGEYACVPKNSVDKLEAELEHWRASARAVGEVDGHGMMTTIDSLTLEIDRLNADNAALSAVACPLDMAVGDESGSVVCDLPNQFNDEGCQYKCQVVDRLKAEVVRLGEGWDDAIRIYNQYGKEAADLKAQVGSWENDRDFWFKRCSDADSCIIDQMDTITSLKASVAELENNQIELTTDGAMFMDDMKRYLKALERIEYNTKLNGSDCEECLASHTTATEALKELST